MIEIGVAKTDITPRSGIKLGGFGKMLQPSLGVYDPLYAIAMVSCNENDTIVLLNCDLLMLPEDFVKRVKTLISKSFNIPAGNIMISCTHTHFAPDIFDIEPLASPSLMNVEQTYSEYLLNQLTGLVGEAYTKKQPAKIRIGYGSSDIGINRREINAEGKVILGNNPGGFIDRTVNLCRIESLSGEPIAAIVNFACHPVTQNTHERKVSADYPGRTKEVVEQLTGATCIFWQGACGNINPLNAESDYSTARSFGTRLGCEAVRIWESTAPAVDDTSVIAISRHIELPGFRFLSLEHAKQKYQEAFDDFESAKTDSSISPGLLTWFENRVTRIDKFIKAWMDSSFSLPAITAELQVFKMSNLVLACIPFELFAEIGLRIKASSPFPNTFIVGYANAVRGYLPNFEAFKEGGYEADDGCNVAPEAIDILLKNYKEMFEELNS